MLDGSRIDVADSTEVGLSKGVELQVVHEALQFLHPSNHLLIRFDHRLSDQGKSTERVTDRLVKENVDKEALEGTPHRIPLVKNEAKNAGGSTRHRPADGMCELFPHFANGVIK